METIEEYQKIHFNFDFEKLINIENSKIKIENNIYNSVSGEKINNEIYIIIDFLNVIVFVFCASSTIMDNSSFASYFATNSYRRKSFVAFVLRTLQGLHTQMLSGQQRYDIRSILESGIYGAIISTPISNYLESIMLRIFGKSTLGRILFTNFVTFPIVVVFLFGMKTWQLNRNNKELTASDVYSQLQHNVMIGLWPTMKNLWLYMIPLTFFVQHYLSPSLWIPTYELFSFIYGLLLKYYTVARHGSNSLIKK